MQAKAATLLIKVKTHRDCPLNEEVDIRSEMGRRKEEEEKTWNTPTNRTIYQWSEVCKTKKGTSTTKQTAWTQSVRNRIRQKSGEIRINPHEAKENIHLRSTSISRTLFHFFSFSGTSVSLSKSRDTGAAQKKELVSTIQRATILAMPIGEAAPLALCCTTTHTLVQSW